MASHPMASDVEPAGQRSIRSALLQGLSPGTPYLFQLRQDDSEVDCESPRYRWHLGCILLKMAAISLPTGSPVRRFRMVAASAKEGVKFVVGGDTGSTPASRQMMATAAARSPDFAVHGKATATIATSSDPQSGAGGKAPLTTPGNASLSASRYLT